MRVTSSWIALLVLALSFSPAAVWAEDDPPAEPAAEETSAEESSTEEPASTEEEEGEESESEPAASEEEEAGDDGDGEEASGEESGGRRRNSEEDAATRAKDKQALESFGNYLGDSVGGVADTLIKDQQRRTAATPRSKLGQFEGGRARAVPKSGLDTRRPDSNISQAQRQFDPFRNADFEAQSNSQAELVNRAVEQNRINSRAIEKQLEAEKQRMSAITSAIGGLIPGGGGLGGFFGKGSKNLFSGLFSSFSGSDKEEPEEGGDEDASDDAPDEEGSEEEGGSTDETEPVRQSPDIAANEGSEEEAAEETAATNESGADGLAGGSNNSDETQPESTDDRLGENE